MEKINVSTANFIDIQLHATNEDASKPERKGKRPPMSEEDKKKKFGDKYDPNYGKGSGEVRTKGSDDDKSVSYKANIPWKNDWKYYAMTEKIAQDLANFPYNTLAGVPVIVDVNAQNGTARSGIAFDVQNVLTVVYVPGIGVTSADKIADQISGINLAATQLYVYLRHKNSGARNYEPADVIMAVLAMRDVYAEFLELRRAIGIVQFFSLENRACPTVLMNALGIDMTDLMANITQYRGQLNILAHQINSVAIPKYFTAFDRMEYICSNVFSDSDSIRGQFYLFRKQGYYTWSSTASSTGSSLVYTSPAYQSTLESKVKLQDRINNLVNMVGTLLADTDVNTILGDVIAVFSDADLYQLAEIPDDYIVVPKFDEDICAQIENAYAVTAYSGKMYYNASTEGSSLLTSGGGTAFGDTLNITQQNGYVVWEPKASSLSDPAGGAGCNNYMTRLPFNSHKDDVAYTDNLEWSRLITIAHLTQHASGSGVDLTIDSCGLELVLGFGVYSINGKGEVKQSITTSYDINASTAAIAEAPFLVSMLKLEQFDWHPFVTVYVADSFEPTPGSALVDIVIGGDFKKWTFLERQTIESTHEGANAAAFYARTLY